MTLRRKEVQDAELIDYLAHLPTEEILIGSKMREIVRPDYLLADDRDAIVAAFSAIAATDMVLVPARALRWLTGEAPDADGKWFGEHEDEVIRTPRKRTPAYWWRSKFRSMVPNWPKAPALLATEEAGQ